MKTTKVILMSMLMLAATFGYCQAERLQASEQPELYQNVVKISFRNAVHSRGLVYAMHQQLDADLIQNEQQGHYVGKVRWNKSVYLIYGTYREWKRFFRNDLDKP